MFYWVYDYPNWQVATLFTLGVALASIIGLMVFRRFAHAWLHRDDRVNEMVGFAMSSFSMLYGLLLGLLAVAAYQGYSVTSDLVTRESGEVAALYRASGALPAPVGAELQAHLRGYVRNVIDVSWPLQQAGILPKDEIRYIDLLLDKLHGFEPQTPRQEIVQGEALGLANDLVQTRRARQNSVELGIPDIMWWVVLVGGLINIVLLWMLGMARHTHIILTGLIGGFLGLVIFLVATMDFPFRGEVSVTPEAFERVYQSLMTRPPH